MLNCHFGSARSKSVLALVLNILYVTFCPRWDTTPAVPRNLTGKFSWWPAMCQVDPFQSVASDRFREVRLRMNRWETAVSVAADTRDGGRRRPCC